MSIDSDHQEFSIPSVVSSNESFVTEELEYETSDIPSSAFGLKEARRVQSEHLEWNRFSSSGPETKGETDPNDNDYIPSTDNEHIPLTDTEHIPLTAKEHIQLTDYEHIPLTAYDHIPLTDSDNIPVTDGEHVPLTDNEKCDTIQYILPPNLARKFSSSTGITPSIIESDYAMNDENEIEDFEEIRGIEEHEQFERIEEHDQIEVIEQHESTDDEVSEASEPFESASLSSTTENNIPILSSNDEDETPVPINVNRNSKDSMKGTGSKQFKISVVSIPSYETTLDFGSDQELTRKSASEILLDIASGKWSKKSLVLDEEKEGTKKLDCRPCSNANCVREAERQKRRKQVYKFNMSKDALTADDTNVFESDSLPSYHSLVDLWNSRNTPWNRAIFTQGGPKNELEFLKTWRDCRRNPEKYGIRLSTPKELPDRKKNQIDSLEMLKSRPIQSPALRQKIAIEKKLEKMEKEKIIKRIEELRRLHSHLPPITGFEGKTMRKLRLRLKQAEDWHRLVTCYEPKDRMKPGNSKGSLSQNDLDLNKNLPRYAATTKSFLRKMKAPILF